MGSSVILIDFLNTFSVLFQGSIISITHLTASVTNTRIMQGVNWIISLCCQRNDRLCIYGVRIIRIFAVQMLLLVELQHEPEQVLRADK